jgi:hypothetical protein
MKGGKLSSYYFDKFDQQVEKKDVPVFYFGEPPIENSRDLVCEPDDTKNAFEKRCTLRWKSI